MILPPDDNMTHRVRRKNVNDVLGLRPMGGSWYHFRDQETAERVAQILSRETGVEWVAERRL